MINGDSIEGADMMGDGVVDIDGANNGIRIKSNSSRGLVHDVACEDICIRDTPAGAATNLIPRFEDILLPNVHIEAEGRIPLDGFAMHPLGIAFDHVFLAQPNWVQIAVTHSQRADFSPGSSGSTFRWATVELRSPDFHASNLTFANDFNRTHEQQPQGSQAIALFVKGHRGVFRNVRLLGNQDTLYAASANCNPESTPCTPARQYFSDCYIEGNVDFIFGDGKAITAQAKHYLDKDRGFVMRNCTLTAAPGVWLGRSWRFSDTTTALHIAPQGWREWHPGETKYHDTVYYAEYDSNGPGGSAQTRDPHTRLLSQAEADRFLPAVFLAGSDGWNPEKEQ